MLNRLCVVSLLNNDVCVCQSSINIALADACVFANIVLREIVKLYGAIFHGLMRVEQAGEFFVLNMDHSQSGAGNV